MLLFKLLEGPGQHASQVYYHSYKTDLRNIWANHFLRLHMWNQLADDTEFFY